VERIVIGRRGVHHRAAEVRDALLAATDLPVRCCVMFSKHSN
jgi:hypothetical protein